LQSVSGPTWKRFSSLLSYVVKSTSMHLLVRPSADVGPNGQRRFDEYMTKDHCSEAEAGSGLQPCVVVISHPKGVRG
jgi:hypothetical protein